MKLPDYENAYLQFAEQSSTPATPDGGIVKFYAKTDGRFYGVDDAGTEFEMVPMLRGAAPAAAVGYRGTFHLAEGGAGVADVLTACLKKSDDTYAWLTVGLT
jgi:hypothetical protein